ncbi:MAG TPA: LptF/LptG family permease [Steroidobacteraceae bacterium]|nr:LptF/LptG family permease [Steroidobacteraceae bacterium]
MASADTTGSGTAYVQRLPDRLDVYTLRALLGPLLLAFVVLLLAEILQRLLSLFDLAAATGASPLLVARMILSLLPYYLGISMPAGFFAAIFMSVARIGDDNELDAMLATGRSIARMAVPYFLVAAALVGFNFYLFGYLQPLTRYGYDAAVYEARQTGWNARLQDNRFVKVKQGYTLGADTVGGDGRHLTGVFVERRDDGTEEVVTAPGGQLTPSADGSRLLLGLANGLIVTDRPDGSVRTVRFGDAHLNEDFTAVPPQFRARGESERELTLPELLHPPAPLPGQKPSLTASELAGEFHGRIARTVVPLLLPLLALPLGMAAKRGRRAPGTVFAAVALLTLHQALQFGESLGETGRAPAWLAVWLPVVVFGVFGAWLFRSSLQWPGDNPVMRAVSAIEAGFEGLHLRRKTGRN